MITQDDIDVIRTLYTGASFREVLIRRLADAYEEQRDNALEAWRTVETLAASGQQFPADADYALREIAKLEETFK